MIFLHASDLPAVPVRFFVEFDFTDDDEVGGRGGVVVRLLFNSFDDGDSGGVTIVSMFPLILFVYGGGGGRCLGCVAMKAIDKAYEGGSVVGTPGDEFPFVKGTLLLLRLFKIGGVVGGVLL